MLGPADLATQTILRGAGPLGPLEHNVVPPGARQRPCDGLAHPVYAPVASLTCFFLPWSRGDAFATARSPRTGLPVCEVVRLIRGSARGATTVAAGTVASHGSPLASGPIRPPESGATTVLTELSHPDIWLSSAGSLSYSTWDGAGRSDTSAGVTGLGAGDRATRFRRPAAGAAISYGGYDPGARTPGGSTSAAIPTPRRSRWSRSAAGGTTRARRPIRTQPG